MKKFITFLFVCVACAGMHASVLIGDLYYDLDYSSWDNAQQQYIYGAAVTSSPAKYFGKVVIPETVEYDGNTYTVVAIGDYAFSECSGLTEVVIPNTVLRIHYYAFYNCDGLTAVEIPNSVTRMDGYTFAECDNLKEVVIPNSVTYLERSIFSSCPNLVSATLPSGITSIPQSMFYNCPSLKSIDIPSGVTEIGSSAFRNCSSLTSVTLPENVVTIGSNAFLYCSGLSEIVIPDKVNTIGSGTFQYCSNLHSVTIPSSLATLAGDAFQYCLIKEIRFNGTLAEWCTKRWLPSDISTAYTLYINGEKLNSSNLVLPEGLENIGYHAFNGCAGVFAITVPSSVTSIGTGQTIPTWYFAGNTPAQLSEGAFVEDVCLVVDDVDTYKAAWPEYASRIFPRNASVQNVNVTAKPNISALHQLIGEENLINVLDLTVSGTINSYDLMLIRNKMINLRYLDLTEASIEASKYEYYTGICSHADTLLAHSFRNLLSIKLPRTLKYAEKALIDCPDIKYAEFNNGIIGKEVLPYEGNGDLQVVLNEGVTEIQSYAFARENTRHQYYINTSCNTKLHSIALPSSLGKVEAKRFWYCRNLQEVTLGDEITEIGDYAFCECPGLSAITLPQQLTKIGNFAFHGANISEIVIPSGVRSIGDGAFLGAISGSNDWTGDSYGWFVGDYYFRSQGTMIYHYDYYEELRGSNVTIYNSSTYNYYRLSSLASLKKLTFATDSKLSTIGAAAFAFCQLDALVMPDSVAAIGQYAFIANHKLQSVKFGENSALRTINCGVFQNCDALTEMILPAELTSIGELAFSSHTASDALEEIAIPSKLVSIDRAAFYGRKGLEKISFPTSLQTIGDYAFQGCTGLDEIRVPSTLLSVGNYAFDNCSKVTKVYTYTVEPVAIDQNTFSCWHNADLYVPSTSYYTYFYNTQWSQFLSLKEFDEEYSYFYINNDYELGENGTIDGNPDADLNPGSGLIVTGDDTQHVGTITVGSDENGAASIIACENLDADLLTINLVTRKGNWSYFCFPFDILLEQLSFAHQYVLREYDGATRAEYGAGGWVNFVGDMLQKGAGYIFQGAQTDTLTITIPNPQFGCEDYEQVINAYNATNLTNANWNFIGNPFPSWFDMDVLFEFGYSSPIYIWNGTDYQVYRPGDDEYHFHPYEGFFTQNPDGINSIIKWASSGRETKSQADNKRGQGHNHITARHSARQARQAEQKRAIVNLSLTSDAYSDQTRIVFNDAASVDYELGRDAVKMDGGDAPLHIWSMEGKDAVSRLSINERPFGDARVSLGYDAAEDGFYTLAASRMDAQVIIYDNELRQEVDLSENDYTFYSEAGTNTTRFSIIRIKQVTDQQTALGEVADDEQVVNVYTILGATVQQGVRRADLRLDNGVYVLENLNGERSEVVVEK